MDRRNLFDEVIKRLDSSGSTIRCQDLAGMLESLGFEVRDGKKQGHKIFVHHGVSLFTSGGYTCGHGRNPEIKKIYIKKVVKLLKLYESEPIQYKGGDQ